MLETFTTNVHLIRSVLDCGKTQSLYLVPEVLCSLRSYCILFHFILLHFILLLLHFTSISFYFWLMGNTRWRAGTSATGSLPATASRERGECRNQVVSSKQDCGFTSFYSESCYFTHACKTNNNNNTFHFFMMTYLILLP